ncbi:MAG: hypothetical protein HKN92_02945, partial [Chitinophagales bacterium]|nr:hypothetical protein [Chitinophagales bacterium]
MNTTSHNKYLFGLLLLAMIFADVQSIFAQSNSPYSRFNMGVLRDDVFPSYRMSGGLGTAASQLNQINFSNPASYINIHAVTFDLGVNFDGIVLSGQDSVYKTGEGSLSHIAMGIPIKKNK